MNQEIQESQETQEIREEVEYQITFENQAGQRIHGFIHAVDFDDIQEKIKPCKLVGTFRVID